MIGMPDDDFGELGLAVIVPNRTEPVIPDDLLAALGQRLAKFKVPRACVIADALPRNAMGKVQKVALQQRYAEEWQAFKQ